MPPATIIDALERTRDETLTYFSLRDADLARTYGPGKWSVRFILHHLADSEAVFLYRLRRVLSEPRQIIWFYDQDAWAKALDYGTLPLDLSKRIYEAVRPAIIHLADRHYEGSEKIEFVHSISGLRTLKDEIEKVASHNAHHLTQIRLALAG
jgi:hypothetical protein